MTALPYRHDPSEIPANEFDRLPDGRYLVTVSNDEQKETKSGTGTLLVLTLDVVDGEFQGRKWFQNFNIIHQNAEAETIGRQDLERLRKAAGLSGLMENTEQLYGPQFYINVGGRRRKDTGEVEQVIKSYAPYSAPPPRGRPQANPHPNHSYRDERQDDRGAPQDSRQTQRQQAGSGGGSRPWDRR